MGYQTIEIIVPKDMELPQKSRTGRRKVETHAGKGRICLLKEMSHNFLDHHVGETGAKTVMGHHTLARTAYFLSSI